MKTKFYKVTITSQKDGSPRDETFPIDEGMCKAIKSLPTLEEQTKWFTDQYLAYKAEQNYQRNHPVDSFDLEDPDLGFAHQVEDDSLSPKEYCFEEERAELIREAVSHLNPDQQMIINGIFWEGKSQKELAKEFNTTESSMAHRVNNVLAKLRKNLKGKI